MHYCGISVHAAVVTNPDGSTLRKRGLTLALFKVKSVIAGKSKQKEQTAAAHISSTVRGHSSLSIIVIIPTGMSRGPSLG